MNFGKSSFNYQGTDATHYREPGFQSRVGFGGGGGGYNGPGPMPHNFRSSHDRYNGPQGSFMGQRGGGFNRPSTNQFGSSQGSSGSNQNFGGSGQKFGGETQGSSGHRPTPSQYSGFVKPEKQEDRYEGGEEGGSTPAVAPVPASFNRPFSAPSAMRHPYCGPRFSGTRMTGRFGSGGEGGGPMRAGGRGFGRGSRFGDSGGGGGMANDNFSGVEAATAAAARATRAATNLHLKCEVLPSSNVHLTKFKHLNEVIKKLKSKRPNAIDTIHSAANIAHVNIQSEIESGPIVKGTGTFFCLVQFDNVNISCCTGLNKRAAKVEAFEGALQKLTKPFQRVIQIEGGAKELQASDKDFPSDNVRQTVIKPTSHVVADISGDSGDSLTNSIQRESNVEALVDIRKKNYIAKDLGDFVLVEPQDHNSSVNGASILRRSADFSKMLLEYDFAAFGSGGNVRCVLKVEGQVVADVVAYSKMAAKVEASQKAVDKLRERCWTILTKQLHDSNAPEITKDEMFDDLASSVVPNSAASMSTPIADNNLGKKLLQKMGWTGGGMGKDGAGIEEPVTMKQVINREGLGLDAKRGISVDFRSRITELLENYASSERQDDLVFSPHFRKDERVIIHNECRRLSLKSKSNGQSGIRYLIVRRKRSAFQLLEHVMRCGGQTKRYKVVPPGQRHYPWRPAVSTSLTINKAAASGGKQASHSLMGATPASTATQSKSLQQGPRTPGVGQGGLGQGPSGMMGQGQNHSTMAGQASGAARQNNAGMMGQNAGMMGQNLMGMMGQCLAGMMGQNSGTMGQNPMGMMTGMGQNHAGMMGQNLGMMGQNSSGMMGQNSAGMMGQSMGMMGQTSSGMMGQNSGMMGQNSSGMMGQNSGMMGQNSSGMMGQNSSGMMGQNSSGMMGQNSSGMMGQNSGMMGQNSGMMGQNSSGMMGQNSAGMMGQHSAGMIGQNSAGMMGQNTGMMGQNPTGRY